MENDLTDPDTPHHTNTFIIRIWTEWSLSERHYRGYVLHLQSGQKRWFQKNTLLTVLINWVRPFLGSLAPEELRDIDSNKSNDSSKEVL